MIKSRKLGVPRREAAEIYKRQKEMKKMWNDYRSWSRSYKSNKRRTRNIRKATDFHWSRLKKKVPTWIITFESKDGETEEEA